MRRSICFSLVVLLGSVLAQAQPVFITIDYPGATATVAEGVNQLGQVVGCYTDSSGNMHGYTLSKGKFRTLDFPNSTYNAAYGINNLGVIVGTFSTSYQEGYEYKQGKFRALSYSSTSSFISGINDSGDLVGAYIGSCCSVHGFFAKKSNHSLTTLDYPGAQRTFADGLNQTDTVVGGWEDPANYFHGFMWVNGTFTSLDAPGATRTIALGVNSSGAIVGGFNDSAGVSHGLMLSNGAYQTIDFPGATSTSLYGITDLGMFVGSYTDPSGVQHGFFGHL